MKWFHPPALLALIFATLVPRSADACTPPPPCPNYSYNGSNKFIPSGGTIPANSPGFFADFEQYGAAPRVVRVSDEQSVAIEPLFGFEYAFLEPLVEGESYRIEVDPESAARTECDEWGGFGSTTFIAGPEAVFPEFIAQATTTEALPSSFEWVDVIYDDTGACDGRSVRSEWASMQISIVSTLPEDIAPWRGLLIENLYNADNVVDADGRWLRGETKWTSETELRGGLHARCEYNDKEHELELSLHMRLVGTERGGDGELISEAPIVKVSCADAETTINGNETTGEEGDSDERTHVSACSAVATQTSFAWPLLFALFLFARARRATHPWGSTH